MLKPGISDSKNLQAFFMSWKRHYSRCIANQPT